jgi:hypothetical protein
MISQMPNIFSSLLLLEVQVNIFCDAAHATFLATWQSTTGIIIFLNGAPIHWYLKWQNNIESSTFGSEFVNTKIALEMNATLWYKLRMMGLPISSLATKTHFCSNVQPTVFIIFFC